MPLIIRKSIRRINVTENKKALFTLLNEISLLIDKKLSQFRCDKTFKSTIWKVNRDKTYQICYMGRLHDVKNALGTELSVGQNVWVKIPSNSLKDMHICGIVDKGK